MSNEIPDYLEDDTPITNQTWACVSFITPELVKHCKNNFIKVRGIYGVKERAEDRCKELHKIDSTYGVYVVEVGKWISWLDDQKSDLNANDELNKLMIVYKKERVNADVNYEKRKDRLKKSKKEEEVKDLLEPLNEPVTASSVAATEETTGKEIKYLQEDDVISNQRYYCISFLTPEQLENNSTVFGVRGFKIRGMFEKEEEASAYCKKLYENDKYNNIFVADMGHWMSWSNSINNVKNVEYANKDLNNLIKSTNENQEKAKTFTENEANNLQQGGNEVIDESFDEDIPSIANESSESNEETIDNITKELEDARKLYEKMLKNQKKE